jgi:hypothetical protein
LKFGKYSAVEEAEEPGPEPKKRTFTVLSFTEELRVTEADIKVSEESECDGQRAATTGQGIMRTVACSEETLKTRSLCLA